MDYTSSWFGYQRLKNTSNFKFCMLMSLANEDYLNISDTNSYTSDDL